MTVMARRCCFEIPVRLAAVVGACLALLAPQSASAQEGEGGIRCPKTGDILIADPDAEGGGGAIIKVNPLNGNRRLVSANGSPAGSVNFENPYNLTREGGIATDGCEDIYVADAGALTGPGPGDGRIIRVDLETGVRTLVRETGTPSGAFVEDPVGIATDSSGNLVYVDAHDLGASGTAQTAFVERIDPDTGSGIGLGVSEGAGWAFVDPWDIAVESSGDLLVADPAASGGGGSVTRIDGSTMAGTLLADATQPVQALDFEEPHGINARGGILVADGEEPLGRGSIMEVDSSNGGRTNLTHFGDPAMLPNPENPSDIDRKAFGGSPAYFTDADAFGGDGGVISVDTTSGATRGTRSTVSENSAPAGSPNFVNPFGIYVVGLRLVAVAVTPSFTIRPLAAGDLVKRTRTPRGAVIKYTLPEESARMTFTIERRTTGRAGSFRCGKETSGNRNRPKCTRWVRVGQLKTQGEKGKNRERFPGRINGKPLRPGRYRMKILAVNRNGDRSPVEAREFRVVR
jgi:hypothetical protein